MCPDGVADPLTLSSSHPAAGVMVVRAVGEIDLGTAPAWARSLVDACHQVGGEPRSRAPRLVCDLTGVGFLGAAGLAVLVELDERARRLGVALRLVVDTYVVARALELTGLDRTLTVDRTLLEALDRDAA